jgi:hypothetical protein
MRVAKKGRKRGDEAFILKLKACLMKSDESDGEMLERESEKAEGEELPNHDEKD